MRNTPREHRRRRSGAACTLLAAVIATVHAAPAAAAPTDQGAGAVAGTVIFPNGAPVNPFPLACSQPFSLTATGAVAVSWSGASYAGLVSVSSNLSSVSVPCSVETMNVTITGTTGIGILNCSSTGPLPAISTQLGEILLIEVVGSCTIGTVTTPVLGIDFFGVLVPTSAGTDLQTNSAAYTAAVSFQATP